MRGNSHARCEGGEKLAMTSKTYLFPSYRPRDLEQRAGRIVRRGNENKKVRIKRYVTKGTFDSYLFQIVENKQRFISQIMSGKPVSRTFVDKDTATLNYAEIKAIATGNPLIIRKMEIESRLSELRILEQQYMGDKFSLENKINKHFPQSIAEAKTNISGYERDIVTRNKNTTAEFSMRLGKRIYDSESKEKAGELIIAAANNAKYSGQVIGEYRGFQLVPRGTIIYVKGAVNTVIELGFSPIGNIQRIDNAINAFEENLMHYQEQLAKSLQQLESAKEQVNIPFDQEYELKTLMEELTEVDNELDLDKGDDSALIQEKNESELDEILEVEEVTEDYEGDMEL